ncbi:MAG: hypothetical protein HY042_04075 [Spirochaetia bacterium]|nr:hypothetical protein [Spirochaetia bacterium]
MKRTLALGCAALLSTLPLFAEPEKKLPEAGISVDAEITNGYIFRGADIFASKFSQQNKQYGANPNVWTFQPSLTYTSPIEGLTFNLWGSFAGQNRADVDTDKAFQKGPGGSDLIFSQTASTGINPTPASIQSTVSSNLPTTATPVTSYNSTTIPGFYKEQNGLRRADELDFTLSYDNKTSAGRLIFGYIAYTLSNPSKGVYSTGGIITNENYYGNEAFIGYGIKGFEDLTLTLYGDTRTGNQYWKLAYGSEKELGKTLSLLYSISAGYGIKQIYTASPTIALSQSQSYNAVEGWQDITGMLNVKYKLNDKQALKFGVNVSYRPDLRFIDSDTAPGTLPVWINGASPISDGKVADPSQVNGTVNALVNARVTAFLSQNGAFNFTYTPRQKLPRTLYFVNLGYTMYL